MRMNWFRLLPAGLLLMAACKGIPFWRGNPASEKVDAPGQIQLELRDIHYDGETLSGRILAGVLEGRLRLNRQLLSGTHVEARNPVDCNTGLPVKYIIADGFSARRGEDLLILERGYWYGKQLNFPLFDEHFTGPGPECLKAELWLFSFDGQVAARQEIRANRVPRPAPEAGAPEAPPDAGTSE